ncbi:hypothetical protein R3P38DRAFT_3220521 [Favolaschia claudopus]|uniref:Uncharacterized protein n=1 Tax=Favolaschia claudopus TaxID=2862362 RepID=A0AAW0A2N7_9AGAR
MENLAMGEESWNHFNLDSELEFRVDGAKELIAGLENGFPSAFDTEPLDFGENNNMPVEGASLSNTRFDSLSVMDPGPLESSQAYEPSEPATLLAPSEPMLTENLSCSASPASKPVAAPLDLVDQQRLSLFILTCRNRSIPSYESMKAFVESSETPGRDPTGIVETRIQELSDQYAKDVENLYAAIAEDYMDEMEDRYLSFEERLPSGVKMEEDDKSDLRNVADEMIAEFYWSLRRDEFAEGDAKSERSISREWYHALDTTTATFHARIDALSRHRNPHRNSEMDMHETSSEPIEETGLEIRARVEDPRRR